MVKYECLIIFVISCFLNESNTTKVPFLKPCGPNDFKCLLTVNTQISIPYLAAGIPELGVPALEPMYFKNITMDQGYFKFFLRNMKVVGASGCKVVEMEHNVQEPALKITLDCPFEATGSYIFSGHIYLFALKNEGEYKIQTDSIRTTITTKIEEIYGDDGLKYWNLTDYEYFYEPLNKIHLDLGNFFSGDISKVQPMLDSVNSDWWISIVKIGEPVARSIVKNFYDVIKMFFLRVPFNELEMLN
ncbi:unnamed protein product [Parnassius mnemosyne]|uniref:Circadian clock-controlled protein-like n=1 Tax=Parnassius mnemosyne TaxID=213953 RepID=A0AAV1KSR5_9NEOP